MADLINVEIEEIFQSMQSPLDPVYPMPYLSSIYKIGNAVIKSQDLKEVKKRLSSFQIKSLWEVLTALESKSRFYALDPNKRSREAFQNWIFDDIDLLEHIGVDALIRLGHENQNEYRKILIIFIRSHLKNRECFLNFNYHSLTQGTAEQTNESSVWPVIQKCAHLPKTLIKELGKASEKVAKQILLDIKPHAETKEIEAFFQRHYNWPVPKKTPVSSVKSDQLLAQAPSSSFSKAYIAVLDALAVISSGLLFLFRSSIVRVIPVTPYVATPILTLYGLYRLKNYYDDNPTSKLKNQSTTSLKNGRS